MDTSLANPVVALECRNELGESCIWDDRTQQLFWVDILAGEIWSWSPCSQRPPTVTNVNQRIGCIGLREERGLVVALEKSFAVFEGKGQDLRTLATVEARVDGTRLNDGRVDPLGRFVSGGVYEGNPQKPVSAVYALDGDGTVEKLIGNVHCANSICWSPDGTTMYFTDMPTGRIEAFDFDLISGVLSSRRLFVDLAGEPGLPDGSVVDAEGCLWNAQWGGGKIVRYSPSGKVLIEVALPIDNPTCLTFGGVNLDTLYITSAKFSLTSKQRQHQTYAGNLFAFRPGVTGVKERRYRG